MIVYEYLFFGFYSFFRKSTNFKDIAEYAGSFFFSVFLIENILVMVKLFSIDFYKTIPLTSFFLIFFALINVANYFLLIHPRRFKKLEAKYIRGRKYDRYLLALTLTSYIIISFAVAFL